MKTFLKAMGVILATCFVLVVVTITISIIRSAIPKNISSDGFVAVLNVTGVIYSSTDFVDELEDLLEDENLKALVVRVNSPGGVVGPSEEIYRAIKKADDKIPVVVSMGAVAASGGYYAALGGRTIYANAGTLTGSIGVIMEFANTSRLYSWAKVDRYTLKAGKFKDVGSPLRNMTPSERELMQGLLDDIHQDFRKIYQERRKLPDEVIDATADGRILTGKQAKDVGMVDVIGGLQDAIASAKSLAGLPEDAYVHHQEDEESLFEKIFLSSFGLEPLFELLKSFNSLAAQNGGWRMMYLAPIAY